MYFSYTFIGGSHPLAGMKKVEGRQTRPSATLCAIKWGKLGITTDFNECFGQLKQNTKICQNCFCQELVHIHSVCRDILVFPITPSALFFPSCVPVLVVVLIVASFFGHLLLLRRITVRKQSLGFTDAMFYIL